jgi:putative FmdB family regulatory protein
MPTYHYKCDTPECDGEVEFICTVKEKPDVVQCPKCGVKMEQIYSLGGISFKGHGWTPRFGPE